MKKIKCEFCNKEIKNLEDIRIVEKQTDFYEYEVLESGKIKNEYSYKREIDEYIICSKCSYIIDIEKYGYMDIYDFLIKNSKKNKEE